MKRTPDTVTQFDYRVYLIFDVRTRRAARRFVKRSLNMPGQTALIDIRYSDPSKRWIDEVIKQITQPGFGMRIKWSVSAKRPKQLLWLNQAAQRHNAQLAEQ